MNATADFAYFGAGQKTPAYVTFRFGPGLQAALRDRDHLEHDAAVQCWVHLARVSGLRTEDYAAELPSNAEQAKKFWDSVYADANPPQPPPSGAEVMAQVHAEMNGLALRAASEKSVTRIDDYKGPAPPKVVEERPYMQVQRLCDLGMR